MWPEVLADRTIPPPPSVASQQRSRLTGEPGVEIALGSSRWPERTWAAGVPARAAITRRERADGNAPWCAGPLAQPLPAPLRYQHLLEGLEVLNAFARAEHD